MTQAVHVRDILAAGGLQKWAAEEGKKPRQGHETRKANMAQSVSAKVPAAKGRKPADLLLGYDVDRMNGLEARYAGRLEAMKRAGKLILWKFEEIKLRMADGTFYTPDFFIMLPDGSVGFHETKGFWRDDARAKIKIAAELYPMFFFVAVQWDTKAKEWKFERFRRRP